MEKYNLVITNEYELNNFNNRNLINYYIPLNPNSEAIIKSNKLKIYNYNLKFNKNINYNINKNISTNSN